MKRMTRAGFVLFGSAAAVCGACYMLPIIADGEGEACGKEGMSNCSYVRYSSFCEGCTLSMLSTDGCITGAPYTVQAQAMIYGDCLNFVCTGGIPDPDIPATTVTCYWVQSENCGG